MSLTPRYATAILPTMVLVGLGFALAFSALNIQATSGIADEEQGLASGLLQTSGQLGGALALASVTAVVTSTASHHAASAAQTLAAYRPGLVLVSIVGGLGLITALSGLRRRSTVDTEAELSDTREMPTLISID